jgi:uncharacterized repeat protein (TIGR03803 family)
MKNRNLRALFLPVVMVAAILATVAQAQTYTDVYDFDGTGHGCCASYPGVLAQGRDGNLYGTQVSGGANGRGTIFKMTPGGVITSLHDFNVTDGYAPQGGVTLALDGNLYGTTAGGGANSAGTIFKITPAGVHTILHDFVGASGGGFPHNPPVQGPDGKLYGTTLPGTNSSIYQMTTAGVYKILVNLGFESDGPLTLGTDGRFYGVTTAGGTNNRGSVFAVTTAGLLKTLYSFNDPTGAVPYGPILQSADGNFYGTASVGGTLGAGVVYKMTPAGVYSVLHNFDNATRANGITPTTGVVQGSDGWLYGVTSGGGASLSGVIFKIKTDGTLYAVIHSFDGAHGQTPYSQPLLHSNGKIYGLTYQGGTHNDGVLYSLANSLKTFVQPIVLKGAKVGASVQLLGQNLSTTTAVTFGTGPATFTLGANGFMVVHPSAGANTGVITVKEAGGGTLVSPLKFKIIPTITSFTPTDGAVGTKVVITGVSFTGATAVKFTAGKAASFTVNSDTQIAATVPPGAITGLIQVVTPGGAVNSTATFTVP